MKNNNLLKSAKKAVASALCVAALASTFTFTAPNLVSAASKPVKTISATVNQASKKIGVSKAKSIALKNEKLKDSSVTFYKAKLEKDDGKYVYDIAFKKSTKKFEFEIDAYSGKILERHIEYTKVAKSKSKKKIGTTKAKSVALKNVKLKSSQVKFTKTKLEKDDGRYVYEIEFKTSKMNYEFEIDAYSGKIIEKTTKVIETSTSTSKLIGTQKAKEIALKHAGKKESQVKFKKVKTDKENGKTVYEIEFYSGNWEYEYEINGTTGKILEWDKERI